jgi:2-hydroxychromene-2-carboxylate isomerase
MAPPRVEFHFDFGSPNAYLAHLVVPEIEKRTGVTFDYVPILLGGVFKLTNNRSPAEKMAGIKNRLGYEQLEMQRFIRRHGITSFKWNPFFPVNTLLIMRGAVAAQREGVFKRYVDEMFRYMWGEPRDMDDPEVVRATLAECGFDAGRLLALTQQPEVKDELLKNTEATVARGTFGSPTFFVGEEIFFGKDKLGEVEEEIVRATTQQMSVSKP